MFSSKSFWPLVHQAAMVLAVPGEEPGLFLAVHCQVSLPISKPVTLSHIHGGFYSVIW